MSGFLRLVRGATAASGGERRPKSSVRLVDAPGEEELSAFFSASSFPNMFAVVSWGCAATWWLTRALNSHPDISCVHAANTQWSRYGGAPRIDGPLYFRALAAQGLVYKAVGDVHGVNRREIPRLRDLLRDKFEAVVLVRDPLPRLRSQLSLFRRAGYQGWGSLDYIEHIASINGIHTKELSNEQRHFIHGVSMLNAISHEQQVGRIFRTEHLTRQPDKLEELVAVLTRGVVTCPPDWARSATAAEAVNVHTGSRAEIEFDAWQQSIIKAVVTPQAWSAYEGLGYAVPAFV